MPTLLQPHWPPWSRLRAFVLAVSSVWDILRPVLHMASFLVYVSFLLLL